MKIVLQYRGVDYAAAPRLCSPHLPVLGRREREEEKEMKTRMKRCSYLSLEVLDPFFPDCLGDLLAPPPFIPTIRCSSCLLSHNDIVNGNNMSAYHKVSVATMAEWQSNGKANCHLQSSEVLSHLVVCAAER